MTSVLNLARLQRKLDRLPKATMEAIRMAMERQADIIVAMMKSLVPVDTGDLRDSIGWTWGKAPRGSSIVSTVKASLGGDLTITIYAGGAEAFQARWIEHGTQKMAAQPYFYVSWRANKRGAGRAVRTAVRKAARQTAS